MQKTPPVRRRRTPQQREKILAEYRRSSLTQRAFAVHAGISLSTLHLWLRKAAAAPPQSKLSLVQVPNLFSPPSPAVPYRLHLTGGLILEIGPGFATNEVAVLLELLTAR